MSNEHHTQPSPPRSEDEVLADLRALTERERNEIEPLEALLSSKRAHLKQLERALAALSGEETPKPQAPKPKSRASRAMSGGWQISDQRIALVWGLIRHRTDTFTVNRLSTDTPGISNESMRRAINVLREREYVRAVGRGRGGGTLVAVMPGAADREYPDGV